MFLFIIGRLLQVIVCLIRMMQFNIFAVDMIAEVLPRVITTANAVNG